MAYRRLISLIDRTVSSGMFNCFSFYDAFLFAGSKSNRDEIFKRELEIHPWLVLPLIKEVFHKFYPTGVKIRLLSTEYVLDRIRERGVRTLNAIHADILLKIGCDLYHFECQMEKDWDMVLRMLEYDMNIAIVHGKKERSSGNMIDDI